jgi:hypothetical protein
MDGVEFAEGRDSSLKMEPPGSSGDDAVAGNSDRTSFSVDEDCDVYDIDFFAIKFDGNYHGDGSRLLMLLFCKSGN